MAKKEIEVFIEEVELAGDYNNVLGVRGTCSKCGATEECFGRTERSHKRVCILLKENCEDDENNWYTPVVKDDEPNNLDEDSDNPPSSSDWLS